MAKDKQPGTDAPIKRPERMKLTAEESLQCMLDFAKRKPVFVAAVRKRKMMKGGT